LLLDEEGNVIENEVVDAIDNEETASDETSPEENKDNNTNENNEENED
jgi:hypothetical protein